MAEAARWFALALFVLLAALTAQELAERALGVHTLAQVTALDYGLILTVRELIALGCALFGAYAILGLPMREIGLRAPRWSDVLLGAGVGIPSLALIYALLRFAHLPSSLLERIAVYHMMHATGASAALLFVLIALFSPVVQEVVFRGIVLEGLLRYSSAIVAIAIASLIFAGAHVLGGPNAMAFALLTGIAQGYLFWRTRSIVAPSVMHILANGYAFVYAWMAVPH